MNIWNTLLALPFFFFFFQKTYNLKKKLINLTKNIQLKMLKQILNLI